jgi:hypothetical protein
LARSENSVSTARFCSSRNWVIRSEAEGSSALRAATYPTIPITPNDIRLAVNSIAMTLD